MDKYKVYLHGASMTASYDCPVNVFADNETDAIFKAKRKLTNPNGTFSDWIPSMFKATHVEKVE